MTTSGARSIYPPYQLLSPRFDHLDKWSPRLANWGKVNAADLRKLGYVLPCYAKADEYESGDELDASKVETLISEMRQVGGWEAHYACIRAMYLGQEKNWAQVAQDIRKQHGRAFSEARHIHSDPADACQYLADRMCARLDVLDRAY